MDSEQELKTGLRTRFISACDDIINRRLQGVRGWSNLSNFLKIPQSNFSTFKNDPTRVPTHGMIYFLCAEFDVDIRYLYFGSGAKFKADVAKFEIEKEEFELTINTLKGEKAILQKKLDYCNSQLQTAS